MPDLPAKKVPKIIARPPPVLPMIYDDFPYKLLVKMFVKIINLNGLILLHSN